MLAAHRYYSATQEALGVELEPVQGLPRGRKGAGCGSATALGARLDRIIHAVVRAVYTEERQIRPELRVYHEWCTTTARWGVRAYELGRQDDLPLPAEVGESLPFALALAIGPDPVTMLKDVAGLDGWSGGGKSPSWLGITPRALPSFNSCPGSAMLDAVGGEIAAYKGTCIEQASCISV